MANFAPLAARRRGALVARLVATGAIAVGVLWIVGILRFVAMIPDKIGRAHV